MYASNLDYLCHRKWYYVFGYVAYLVAIDEQFWDDIVEQHTCPVVFRTILCKVLSCKTCV